ncbi:MAG TPA: pyridoxamine 5'-phosphate oxidase family protein [Anaerolineae bacterium]|nr:pyridoxamine 5'-phosphate oxidase family protein [Anaerolineae bacterium]
MMQSSAGSAHGTPSTESGLPVEVFEVLRKSDRAANPVVTVATVDLDGSPHTAPFGSLRAISPQILRFGCDRRHTTYSNILRHGRVVVNLLHPPSIAVSISGRANVTKERMVVSETDAVIEVQVQEVKDDSISGIAFSIESGITLAYPADLRSAIEQYVAEVEQD